VGINEFYDAKLITLKHKSVTKFIKRLTFSTDFIRWFFQFGLMCKAIVRFTVSLLFKRVDKIQKETAEILSDEIFRLLY